jgi:hypothetical protein
MTAFVDRRSLQRLEAGDAVVAKQHVRTPR